MARAVDGLSQRPDPVLVDGNCPPRLAMRCEAVVGDDSLVAEISAASILAKVQRDRACLVLDDLFPLLGFAVHKGYGTARHMAALSEHGACAAHRRSFESVRVALSGVDRPVRLRVAQGA